MSDASTARKAPTVDASTDETPAPVDASTPVEKQLFGEVALAWKCAASHNGALLAVTQFLALAEKQRATVPRKVEPTSIAGLRCTIPLNIVRWRRDLAPSLE
jgi:hypothetical protein